MKIMIFGASGIIGQHMRLCVPDGVEAVWYRKTADPITKGFDLENDCLPWLIDDIKPDVVVNLAGESSVDKVETVPKKYHKINVEVPTEIASACATLGIKYVHVSSQAVFDGKNPPYRPDSDVAAVNAYGMQKIEAESAVRSRAVIVRPSFVLGVRPLPYVGRKNPLESMLDGTQRYQVDNRWFSPSDALDVAAEMWNIALNAQAGEVIHLGIPHRYSRHDIAVMSLTNPEPIHQEELEKELGIAPRPIDTTYAGESTRWVEGHSVAHCAVHSLAALRTRCANDITDRAREISMFTGTRYEKAYEKLSQGFHALHAEVAADFRRFGVNGDDDRLLAWYRETEAYIWELSVYHLDPGFNYSGMCKGIIERLKSAGCDKVLSLGDGIGDFTLDAMKAGMQATYHDLEGSRTAQYAQFRIWRHLGKLPHTCLSEAWDPPKTHGHNAVVSLDFLEHVTDVEKWAKAIYDALVHGGLFFAQNAFNIGSGDSGSIPMHLTRNDRFEHDWNPLLLSLGFENIGPNWYKKR